MAQDSSNAPPQAAARPDRFVIAALLVTTFFWGSSFAVAKYALRQLEPLALASLRFLVAGALYAGVLLLNRRRFPRVARGDWKYLAGLSLLGVTTYFWVQYTAVSLTTATNASLLIATAPLAVALLSAFLQRSPLGLNKWLGILISYSGVLLLVSAGSLSHLWQAGSLQGNLLMLFNACCWALFTVLGRKITQRYPPFLVTAWIGILGGIGLFPLGISRGLLEALPTLSLQTWLAVIYLAIPCTLIGYGGWYYALSKIDASRTAPFQYLQPLYTACIAAVLLGELPTWHALCGGSLIIAGLFWSNYARSPARVVVAYAPSRGH